MTAWKEHAIQFVRSMVTAVVVVVVLWLIFAGQANQEQEVQEQTLNANLATACVLALPSDPVSGRDPESVRLCFTQYGLKPPSVVPS